MEFLSSRLNVLPQFRKVIFFPAFLKKIKKKCPPKINLLTLIVTAITDRTPAKSFGKFDEINDGFFAERLIAAPLSALVDDEKLARWFHLIPFFLLPILITHVVSSQVIFIPLFLVILLIYGPMFWWLRGEIHILFSKFKLFSLLFFCRVIPSFLFLILFQTFTNFSIMFYSGESWAEVIKYEFLNRDTRCYANAFLNSLQVYNLGLAGLIFA